MEKEKSICFSLKRVNHIVERGIHTSLAAAGFDEITNMHGWILGFLYHAQHRSIKRISNQILELPVQR